MPQYYIESYKIQPDGTTEYFKQRFEADGPNELILWFVQNGPRDHVFNGVYKEVQVSPTMTELVQLKLGPMGNEI